MGKNIPDRWQPYSDIGQVVNGTRFIAFKVPLKEELLRHVPKDEWFTPTQLLEKCPNLGIVIDLTFTKRYYDPEKDFICKGIEHEKILVPGKQLPTDGSYAQFMRAVDRFCTQTIDKVIGVHCTHGLNRTGYFICRYMIERLGFQPHNAISAFESARGHAMEREIYINDLLSRGERKDIEKYERIKKRDKPDDGMSRVSHNEHQNKYVRASNGNFREEVDRTKYHTQKVRRNEGNRSGPKNYGPKVPDDGGKLPSVDGAYNIHIKEDTDGTKYHTNKVRRNEGNCSRPNNYGSNDFFGGRRVSDDQGRQNEHHNTGNRASNEYIKEEKVDNRKPTRDRRSRWDNSNHESGWSQQSGPSYRDMNDAYNDYKQNWRMESSQDPRYSSNYNNRNFQKYGNNWSNHRYKVDHKRDNTHKKSYCDSQVKTEVGGSSGDIPIVNEMKCGGFTRYYEQHGEKEQVFDEDLVTCCSKLEVDKDRLLSNYVDDYPNNFVIPITTNVMDVSLMEDVKPRSSEGDDVCIVGEYSAKVEEVLLD